jgi:SAM-dependent methyltransferase
VKFIHGLSTEIPSESFDQIVCSDVIEHVADPGELIGEILRILRPGGSAVISTPIRYTEYPLDKEHVIEWFPDEFKSLFAGCNLLEYHESNPVALMDFMNMRFSRALLNVLSVFVNPFQSKSGFRHFSLQYAVIKK